MEGSPRLRSPRLDESEFNLKEWHLRARISRENTLSRRYSASYIRSFREDSRSFRSNFTISSTTSSPGQLLAKDEIDPSTYSFSTALKALQARSGYVWEWLSPDNQAFALNSKWDEAERYICNPLSGEVPMECLSSKTLSGRSFRNSMAARVTMSAPLVFSANPRIRTPLSYINNNITIPKNNNEKNPSISFASVSDIKEQILKAQFPTQVVVLSKTRDVGTQSTPPSEKEKESSSNVSLVSTPSIREREIRRSEETEDGDAHNSSSSTTTKTMDLEVEMKGTREEEETKGRAKESGKKKKNMKAWKLCFYRQSCGCFFLSSSWTSLCIKIRPPNPKNIRIIQNYLCLMKPSNPEELR